MRIGRTCFGGPVVLQPLPWMAGRKQCSFFPLRDCRNHRLSEERKVRQILRSGKIRHLRSPNVAPATKNESKGIPNAAHAMKSEHIDSPITAPATKIETTGSPNAAHTTKNDNFKCSGVIMRQSLTLRFTNSAASQRGHTKTQNHNVVIQRYDPFLATVSQNSENTNVGRG